MKFLPIMNHVRPAESLAGKSGAIKVGIGAIFATGRESIRQCAIEANPSEALMSERINARLSQPLAEFVGRMVGENGLYETPSEYIRDLIRRDMERRDVLLLQDAIVAGYRDLAAGRVVESSGDFKTDMALLDQKEAGAWQ
jgi:antitoxin ParD1/3/4